MLCDQVQYVKMGIYVGGGMFYECFVVLVFDGLLVVYLGMWFFLILCELIVDSVEVIVCGYQWDGIFGIGGCDKNMFGLMMGMLCCNVLLMFVYGGLVLFGFYCNGDVNIVDSYEMIGWVLVEEVILEELDVMI